MGAARARLLPLLLAARVSSARDLICADVRRWLELRHEIERSGDDDLLAVLAGPREFRTLFFHRLYHGGGAGRALGLVLSRFYRLVPTLELATPDIGPGLVIYHGFATILGGRIGARCTVNSQVNVGYERDESPVVGDDVRIGAGAKLVGGITVGSRSLIGANSVVVDDVPADSVAVGVPARVVKREGRRVAPA